MLKKLFEKKYFIDDSVKENLQIFAHKVADEAKENDYDLRGKIFIEINFDDYVEYKDGTKAYYYHWFIDRMASYSKKELERKFAWLSIVACSVPFNFFIGYQLVAGGPEWAKILASIIFGLHLICAAQLYKNFRYS